MTFPTILAGTRANEAIGGYDNFVEYLNAVSAGVDSVTTTAAGAALKANNLSDLASAQTARQNLGLGDAATRDVGSTAGTVAAGDDSRLTDARTPTAHTHPTGDITGLGTAAVTNTGTGASNTILGNDARLTDTRTPTDNTVSTAKIVDGAVTDAKLASAKIAASLVDAKGDLLIGTASDTPGRLAVAGNDVSVLRGQSAAASGLAYVQDRPAIPVGNYFAVNGGFTSVAIYNSGGQATVCAASIPHPMTISEVRIRIASAATAGQTLRLVAYNVAANGWQPGTLLADWGTVAADSTGVKAVTGLSTVLPAGIIFLGYVPITTAATGGSVFGQPLGTGQSSNDATLNVINAAGFIGTVGTGSPTSPFPGQAISNGTCAFELKRSA